MLLALVACATGRTPRTGTIAGRVTDTGGRPLAGAAVVVCGTRRGVVADSDGAFVLRSQSLQSTELCVRKIGYVPVRRRTVPGGPEAILEIPLTPIEKRLGSADTVPLEGGARLSVRRAGPDQALPASGIAIDIRLESEANFPCRLELLHSYGRADRRLRLDVMGVMLGAACPTAVGPASLVVHDTLAEGSYALFVRIGSSDADEFLLEVAGKPATVRHLGGPRRTTVSDATR